MSRFIVFSLISSICISSMAETKTFRVEGMTCGGCKKLVEAKLCQLPNLTTCKVEVGKVTLSSPQPLDFDKASAAVSAAGDYKLFKD